MKAEDVIREALTKAMDDPYVPYTFRVAAVGGER